MTRAQILAAIALLEEELRVLLNPHTMTPTEEKIYTQAKLHLGQHLTLNNAIPAEVGCAEAVSKVLSLAGISDGSHGISGTASLYEWLVASPLFEKVDEPEQGAIILSPTGMGNGSVEGHTGIIGSFGLNFPNTWGIMSNESATGKFMEIWSWPRWEENYGTVGNLPIYYFRAV